MIFSRIKEIVTGVFFYITVVPFILIYGLGFLLGPNVADRLPDWLGWWLLLSFGVMFIIYVLVSTMEHLRLNVENKRFEKNENLKPLNNREVFFPDTTKFWQIDETPITYPTDIDGMPQCLAWDTYPPRELSYEDIRKNDGQIPKEVFQEMVDEWFIRNIELERGAPLVFKSQPARLEGGIIARLRPNEDGGASSEVFQDGKWIPGSTVADVFFNGSRLSPNELRALGLLPKIKQ